LAAAVTLATPELLVVAVAPFGKVAEAPDGGALNVTVWFGITFPAESFTVACNGSAKLVLNAAVWPDPPVAVTVAGGPGFTCNAAVAVILVVVPTATCAVSVSFAPTALTVTEL
jgi:hypothetical protein